MRVAIFNVSHWHFPLYIPALRDRHVRVIGVTDAAEFAGRRFANELNCRLYANDHDLMNEDFDFALVFSRHSEMAALAERLILRGTPFLIEKPCGVNLREVRGIRLLSEKHGVFVSVPFIVRVSDWVARLSPSEGLTPKGFQHLSFRFVVGPLTRYERGGCDWMLDGRHAGGGSMLNVGVHFIDLFSTLTNQPITTVSAQTRSYRSDASVEEHAVFTCCNASGQIAVLETGYLYPSTLDDQRDFAFSISHTSAYVRGFGEQLLIKRRDGQPGLATTIEYNTDAFYPPFLRRSWQDLEAGRAPVAGLRSAEHAIAVVEAGYRSAHNGGTPEAVELVQLRSASSRPGPPVPVTPCT
ncbi:MAG: Gfo/Idh/MocA family protein [Microvirga sp.]|jgi:predicted dehydrogenase